MIARSNRVAPPAGVLRRGADAHRRARTVPRIGGAAGRWAFAPLVALPLVAVCADVGAAGDATAGRTKAQMCQACHGMDGLSKVPDAPNIAGQVEAYLVTQLQAFKSGARKSEAMSVVAAALSDRDIENLAAYFAAIEIRLGKVPGE